MQVSFDRRSFNTTCFLVISVGTLKVLSTDSVSPTQLVCSCLNHHQIGETPLMDNLLNLQRGLEMAMGKKWDFNFGNLAFRIKVE